MLKKKLFFWLFSALLGNIISLQALEVPFSTSEHQLIHKILENYRYCVSAFEDDKIFIRPENIVSNDQGLFINLNGKELHPLPLLQHNRNGLYLQVGFMQEEFELLSKKETKGPCPNCGVDTDYRGVCINPDCWFKGFKVL